MKQCTKCQQIKEFDQFRKQSSSKDGLTRWCKSCFKEYEQTDAYKQSQKSYKSSDSHRQADRKRKKSPRSLELSRNLKKTEKYKNQTRIRYSQRYKEDVFFRIKKTLRNRTNDALNQNQFYKTSKLSQYLGCTVEQLKQYLEDRFLPDMSWDNYGFGQDKWNIDHIVPLSSAKTPEDLYKLCHFSNLQPLWQPDNLKKSDNYVQNMVL